MTVPPPPPHNPAPITRNAKEINVKAQPLAASTHATPPPVSVKPIPQKSKAAKSSAHRANSAITPFFAKYFNAKDAAYLETLYREEGQVSPDIRCPPNKIICGPFQLEWNTYAHVLSDQQLQMPASFIRKYANVPGVIDLLQQQTFFNKYLKVEEGIKLYVNKKRNGSDFYIRAAGKPEVKGKPNIDPVLTAQLQAYEATRHEMGKAAVVALFLRSQAEGIARANHVKNDPFYDQASHVFNPTVAAALSRMPANAKASSVYDLVNAKKKNPVAKIIRSVRQKAFILLNPEWFGFDGNKTFGEDRKMVAAREGAIKPKRGKPHGRHGQRLLKALGIKHSPNAGQISAYKAGGAYNVNRDINFKVSTRNIGRSLFPGC